MEAKFHEMILSKRRHQDEGSYAGSLFGEVIPRKVSRGLERMKQGRRASKVKDT